jgi:hypothetical protein
MRIISSIEDPSVIRDILNHLGLWLAKARPPQKAFMLLRLCGFFIPRLFAAGFIVFIFP